MLGLFGMGLGRFILISLFLIFFGIQSSKALAEPIRLSLKIISYEEQGVPILKPSAAQELIKKLNEIWSPCEISFRLKQYRSVDARALRFPIPPLSMKDLPVIRSAFQSSDELVIVLTTRWGTEGDINATGADAWTTLPGNGPHGVIVDAPVSSRTEVIAHEMGHYFNLMHVENPSNLLNPEVFMSSTSLSTFQCEVARSAILHHWKEMIF